MTGYGIAQHDSEGNHYSVEIKSLNSKFLELNLKLPKAFSDKELLLRNEGSKLLVRGKVTITITAENDTLGVQAAKINTPLLRHYYQELKTVANELGAPADRLLETALTLPEVVSYTDTTADEHEWQSIYSLFLKAVEQFDQFRKDEGNVLKEDLTLRSTKILELLTIVEEKEINRVPLIRERIEHYLVETVGKENIDRNRFEQELIYYIDKLDITEEKVRLKSHCHYFIKVLDSTDANGKKLGFISQEMGREINTLGSKANDPYLQQVVVQMKEELEKIKEQLLNVI